MTCRNSFFTDHASHPPTININLVAPFFTARKAARNHDGSVFKKNTLQNKSIFITGATSALKSKKKIKTIEENTQKSAIRIHSGNTKVNRCHTETQKLRVKLYTFSVLIVLEALYA